MTESIWLNKFLKFIQHVQQWARKIFEKLNNLSVRSIVDNPFKLSMKKKIEKLSQTLSRYAYVDTFYSAKKKEFSKKKM